MNATDPLRRPCRYCRVPYPCDAHAPDCPSETNLWPVEERDVEPHGFCCMDCGEPFAVGESYTVAALTENRGVVVCLSCAAVRYEVA